MPDFELTPVDYDPFADSSNVVSGVPVQQAPGRLTINPQRGQAAPEGLPPPQPTPPSIQGAMEHQQNWGMPPASEQLGNIGASVLANPITNIAQRGAGGPPQPPLSDDPAEMDRYQEAQKRYYGGNFMDVLGLAAPQMARAEAGSAGIFGGQGAKTANLNKLAEAQRMFKEGVPAKESIAYPETISSAAIKLGDNVYRGPSHAWAIDAAQEALGLSTEEFWDRVKDQQEGFITSTGRFVDRKEAEAIANAANQISPAGEARLADRRLRYGREDFSSQLLADDLYAELPGVRSKLGALGSGDENAPESMAARAAADASAEVRRRIAAGERPPEGWISQRNPNAPGSTEDPIAQPLLIGKEEMMRPGGGAKGGVPTAQYNADLVSRYGNAGEYAKTGMPHEEVTEGFINHVKDNLIWLYNKVDPNIKPRSMLWYDGGNRIIQQRAFDRQLGMPHVAGIYAAGSPQNEWFNNLTMGDRILDIYHDYYEHQFDPKMLENAKRVFVATKEDWKKDPVKAQQKQNDFDAQVARIQGKRFSQLSDWDDKAAWIRSFDEAHNSPYYRVVSPEGEYGDFYRNEDGSPKNKKWISQGMTANALKSLEAPDLKTISDAMGVRHKVRNFYNNLLHPNSWLGDVTIDTHAVAAALLRPLAGDDIEVAHNLQTGAGKPPLLDAEGKKLAARGSDVSGVKGLYGLYAEAYRRAAAELGILPRQLQSVTWEAGRGLFPEKFKNKANKQIIDQIWKRTDMDIGQKREAIHDFAKGIDPPEWYKAGSNP